MKQSKFTVKAMTKLHQKWVQERPYSVVEWDTKHKKQLDLILITQWLISLIYWAKFYDLEKY